MAGRDIAASFTASAYSFMLLCVFAFIVKEVRLMAWIIHSIDRASSQSQCCGKTVKAEHRTPEIGITLVKS
jgi:hypothetical protein